MKISDYLNNSIENDNVVMMTDEEFEQYMSEFEVVNEEDRKSNPWGVLGFFVHSLGFGSGDTNSEGTGAADKIRSAKATARKEEAAKKIEMKKKLKQKKSELKAAVITAKSKFKQNQTSLIYQNKIDALQKKLKTVKEMENSFKKNNHIYTENGQLSMFHTLEKLGKGMNVKDRDEYDKIRTQLTLLCTNEDGTVKTKDQVQQELQKWENYKDPKLEMINKALKEHGVQNISQLSDDEYNAIVEEVAEGVVDTTDVEGRRERANEKLREANKRLADAEKKERAAQEAQTKLNEFNENVEKLRKLENDPITEDGFEKADNEDDSTEEGKKAIIERLKKDHPGLSEATIKNLYEKKANNILQKSDITAAKEENNRSKENIQKEIRSQIGDQGIELNKITADGDIVKNQQTNLEAILNEANEHKLTETEKTEINSIKTQAESDIEDCDSIEEQQANQAERIKELHRIAKEEEEEDKLNEKDPEFGNKVDKNLEGLDKGEVYCTSGEHKGKRGYYDANGAFKLMPKEDDETELKNYEKERTQAMMLSSAKNKGMQPYSEGENENKKYYKIKREIVNDNGVEKVIYNKVQYDPKTGQEIESGKVDGKWPTVSQEDATIIETQNKQAEINKSNAEVLNAAEFKKLQTALSKEDSERTDEDKELISFFNRNETTLTENLKNSGIKEEDIEDVYATLEEKITKDQFNEYDDIENDDGDSDDVEYDDERGNKLKNPAKIWHRKRKKDGSGMTKNYYNEDGNSIKPKVYKQQLKNYQNAKKRASTTTPQQTSPGGANNTGRSGGEGTTTTTGNGNASLTPVTANLLEYLLGKPEHTNKEKTTINKYFKNIL